MYDLEDRGFITQPHTSAGRIPTDKGYRYYVDRIMKFTEISDDTKDMIRSSMVAVDQSDLHLLLEAATRALSTCPARPSPSAADGSRSTTASVSPVMSSRGV